MQISDDVYRKTAVSVKGEGSARRIKLDIEQLDEDDDGNRCPVCHLLLPHDCLNVAQALISTRGNIVD